MFTTLFAATLSLLAATPLVHGHGYVQEVKTSLGTYTGYNPYVDPYMNPTPQRIIRKVPGNGICFLIVGKGTSLTIPYRPR